jgi:hypothetical protein
MKKHSVWMAVLVLAVAATAWLFGGRGGAPQASTSALASPASAGSVVVMPSRDLTFFYVVDASDGNIYVVDVSGGSGEIRGVKLGGNFRTRKTY